MSTQRAESGFRPPLHQPRYLAELAPHLLDHPGCGPPYGRHREGGDQEGEHAADEETHHHVRIGDVDQEGCVGDLLHLGGVGREERERRERRRADRKSLPDRSRGVADRVQRVGHLARLGAEPGHLGDPARVVGHWTVGVDRHGGADRREHPDRSDPDPVESARQKRDQDGAADQEERQGRGLHPHGEARDDVRRRSGLRRAGDLPHRAGAGVVLGHHADRDADDRTRQDRPEWAQRRARTPGDRVHDLHVEGSHHKEHRHKEEPRRDQGDVAERGPRFDALQELHRGDPDERADEADEHGHNRKRNGLGGASGERRRRGADRDRRHDRPHVRLEDVGAHPGDVAHIVAHIVGDGGGVARVVLRDARLDLPHQVGADVGRLGEDPAAHAGEERNRGGTHREAGDDGGEVRELAGPRDRVRREEPVEEPDPEEPQRGDREPHHRAPEEGDAKRLPLPLGVCRGRGAHIGAGGGLHAEEARQDARRRSGHIGERRVPPDRDQEKDRDDGHEEAQHGVLASQKGHRAIVNLLRQIRHRGRPLRLADQIAVDEERRQQPHSSHRPRPGGQLK